MLSFACLSDADLNTVKVPEFPWPLDEAFSKSHKILWTGNIKSMSTHAENKKFQTVRALVWIGVQQM